jgi:flagellar hook-associated protein 1
MIGNLLNTARSAIIAHQAAVQVTAQNVSNAQTDGYSRQRVDLASAPSVRTVHGVLGSGVVITGTSRARDSLLDATFRRESGNAAGFGMNRDVMMQVEEIFAELSDSGLGSALDAFWSSWSELAATPLNASARGMVLTRADQLAHSLNNSAARLDTIRATVEQRLDREVDELNRLVRQVASLNSQVAGAEVGGRIAPELRDERDRLLDAIASIAAIQVSERSDGSLAVHLGSATLVDGAFSNEVTLDASRRVRVGSATIHEPGGTLGGLAHLREVELPATRQRLDTFAGNLVDAVNTAHAAGSGGQLFFDPAGVTAATLSLAADLRSNPERVGAVPGAPGDNSLMLGMAGLRDSRMSFAGEGEFSFNGYLNDIVTGVGLRAEAAQRSHSVYATLAGQADIRRSSVSGVSTEEEMMNLMRHQQAYQAATRLVQAADEMMKTVLNMV